MAALNELPPRASLLGLPAELRLRIYEAAYEEDPCVRLYGRDAGAGCIAKGVDGACALPRTCRLIHREIMPVRPAISKLHFHFEDFDKEDFGKWYLHMESNGGVDKIRKLSIDVFGQCTRRIVPLHGDSLRNCDNNCTKKRCGRDCGRLSNFATIWRTIVFCQRLLEVDLDRVESCSQDNLHMCWRARSCAGTIEYGQSFANGSAQNVLKELRRRIPKILTASSTKPNLSREKVRNLLDAVRGLHVSKSGHSRRCAECEGLVMVPQEGRGKAEPFLR